MHGLGNSYLYIDGWANPINQLLPLAELARKFSCPYTGVGSDGVILIAPSTCADVKMRIFNKDGSEGKNCGNGVRCVAKYAYEQGLVKNKTMRIETLGGIVQASILKTDPLETLVSVNMGLPKLPRNEIPMKGDSSPQVINEPFQIGSHQLQLTAVSMGNPHAIFFTKENHHQLHLEIGPQIENDARFPERINVEFLTVESPNSLRCRVWERGSGATQACGTGACASAVAAILNGYCKRDQDIAVKLDGGTLIICWKSDGTVWMTGPAVSIFSGTLTW